MIGPIPRRLAALLAAVAFGLALAEGLLAGLCGPGSGLERCGEEVMVHFPDEMDSAEADCCLSVDGPPGTEAPFSGDDGPTPCPFTPMGPGSCQAVSFPAPALAKLPTPSEGTWALDASTPIRDLLPTSPPFQPPRA